MNKRELTLANQHKDLEKGDLIAVSHGGTMQVGVYSQLTKRNVLRYIPNNKVVVLASLGVSLCKALTANRLASIL